MGIDIDPTCAQLSLGPNVTILIGDASDPVELNRMLANAHFDIIIDDGSHRSEHVIATFKACFGRLKPDGVYIVEDMHASYFASHGGGFRNPGTSMEWFKGLLDVLNVDHFQSNVTEKLDTFTLQRMQDLGGQIACVTFFDSIVLIKKLAHEKHAPYRRIITGQDAQVVDLVSHVMVVPQGQLRELLLPQPTIAALTPAMLNALASAREQAEARAEQAEREVTATQQRLEDALRRVEKLDDELVAARGRAELIESDLNSFRDEMRVQLRRERLRARQTRENSTKKFSGLAAKLASVEAALRQRQTEIDAHLASTSWRITAPLRAVVRSMQLQRERLKLTRRALAPSGRQERIVITQSVRRRLQQAARAPQAGVSQGFRTGEDYEHWIARFDQLRPLDKQAIRRHVSSSQLPTMLVLVYFDTSSQDIIEVWQDSLENQLLGRWQAVLCFGRDCAPHKVESFKVKTQSDGRFTVVRVPLDGADRQAIAGLEGAAHILVASSDAVLREHTLYCFAVAVSDHPEARLVYSDEDHIVPGGTRSEPWFKPDFSPELLRNSRYLGVCALLHRPELDMLAVVDRVLAEGGVAPFLTRYTQTLNERMIMHVPFILYHHSGKARQASSPQQAVDLGEESLPKVSIIIPTKDRLDLLAPCLASVESTFYPSDKLEVIVIDNMTSDPVTLRFLSTAEIQGRIRLIRDRGPFNYSRLNNRAAALATGDILVFLNNDTEVNRSEWLRRLVSYLMLPNVGVVGAKLLYPNRTVQHGGVVVGIQGVASHAHVGIAEEDGGYQNLANLTHEVSAVTGACMAVRRSVFQELGGFDQALAIAFGDVLLCLAAQARGYRNIFIAEPLIIHHESKTRGYDDTPAKEAVFRQEALYTRKHHRATFRNDPYYNPNLSLERVHDLAWPPRTRRPWHSFTHVNSSSLRVLMLSITHEVGHGVAVVLHEQSVDLAKRGFEVFVGGPLGRNELIYEGCHRVYLDDPQEAACFAFENDIDCIMSHTPPFFAVVRWLGSWPRSIIYDYGEPNPDLFSDDVAARRTVLTDKRFCYRLADRTFAISRSVQAESGYPDMGVIRLGNSHLAVWDSDMEARRKLVRMKLDVDDKLLVLNVCRFHRTERRYKGVDIYADALWELGLTRRDLREKAVFALCGKCGKEDVREMEELGLRVFPNVSDGELIDLYAAADVYMNFSSWEGYNLGIGQALALGLPVIASDIPAHREFPIYTSNDMTMIVRELCTLADNQSTRASLSRKPIIYSWKEPLAQLASTISELCREQPARATPC